MTKESALKHWDLIIKFKEGATIQYYGINTWIDCTDLAFDEDAQYRIKPEVPDTIELWLHISSKRLVFVDSIPSIDRDFYSGPYTYKLI